MEKLEVGIAGQAKIKVDESNTATAYGSGGVEVFATPAMVALMEKAALSSVEPYLADGQSTVGSSVAVNHVAATPLGMEVTATATLVEIDRRRLVFEVEARDEKEVIGSGRHERFIIDLEKFLSKVKTKL